MMPKTIKMKANRPMATKSAMRGPRRKKNGCCSTSFDSVGCDSSMGISSWAAMGMLIPALQLRRQHLDTQLTPRRPEENYRENPVKPGGNLGSLLNFAIANAGRTDADPAASAINQSPNRLQIHVPAPLRHIMGVADSIAELRALSTNFANLCHK